MTIPLPSLPELRAIEADARRGLAAGVLMRRAGESVAAVAWQECLGGLVRPTALVLAGSGGNGGDAFIAALALHRRGVHVRVFACEETINEDACAARSLCAKNVQIASLTAFAGVEFGDCVIDGLLGIGANRPLHSDIAAVVQHANALKKKGAWVLAIDVPTGLNAYTGTVASGQLAVHADRTMTFIAMKPGLLTGSGPNFCGKVSLQSLALHVPDNTYAVIERDDLLGILPTREPVQHKGLSGDLAVLGGANGMVGAVFLAARAALFTGIGRLYACIENDRILVDPEYPEIMVRTWQNVPDHLDAAVVGCGLSQSSTAKDTLSQSLSWRVPLVVDADALNLVAGDEMLAQQIKSRLIATVITPHPLEAARLLQLDSEAIQADRIAAAGQLAQRLNAYVVLKGAGSIIAAPDGRCRINPTGSALLATGGTGDMLAGCIGALLAARIHPFEAACVATYAHGAAAQTLSSNLQGDTGLWSQGFLPLLARTLNSLRGARA
jgi:ADP-dependent NAD(P)H-hydrate dehydratase / NAD(P)H-hydrate epimerase